MAKLLRRLLQGRLTDTTPCQIHPTLIPFMMASIPPCDSEYFEGAVEWGEDDDGTEYFYYSALDMTKDAEIKQLLEQKVTLGYLGGQS